MAWLVSSAAGAVLGGCEGGCDNNPITPACLGAEPCEAGKELLCGKTCTQPVAIGQVCSLDICADGGLCADHGVCVPVPGVGAGRGVCESDPAVVKRFGEACNPSASYEGVAYDECEGTFICNACVGREIPRCAIPMGEHGACSLSCASNNNGCDAGLRCIASGSGGDPDAGTCVRPCAQDSDCPCAGGEVSAGSCVDVVGSTMPMKVCRSQVERGQGCNDYLSCPTGLSCGVTIDGYRCCGSQGEVCREDTECCGVSHRCLPQQDGSSKCGACVQLGQEGCSENADCCEAGQVCDGGRCKLPCVAGEPCYSADGCRDHQGNLEVGATICDPITGKRSCEARLPADREVCNGRNDMCRSDWDESKLIADATVWYEVTGIYDKFDPYGCAPVDLFRWHKRDEDTGTIVTTITTSIDKTVCADAIYVAGWPAITGQLECIEHAGVTGWRCVAEADRDFCTTGNKPAPYALPWPASGEPVPGVVYGRGGECLHGLYDGCSLEAQGKQCAPGLKCMLAPAGSQHPAWCVADTHPSGAACQTGMCWLPSDVTCEPSTMKDTSANP